MGKRVVVVLYLVVCVWVGGVLCVWVGVCVCVCELGWW